MRDDVIEYFEETDSIKKIERDINYYESSIKFYESLLKKTKIDLENEKFPNGKFVYRLSRPWYECIGLYHEFEGKFIGIYSTHNKLEDGKMVCLKPKIANYQIEIPVSFYNIGATKNIFSSLEKMIECVSKKVNQEFIDEFVKVYHKNQLGQNSL